MSVLEIVFVGQCEAFVCLEFVDFFPWPRSSYVHERGVNSLKMSIFSTHNPLTKGSSSSAFFHPACDVSLISKMIGGVGGELYLFIYFFFCL